MKNEQPSIADYALIGNCRTAALVSRRGSIDWLCLPHFSGPSVFGALLDERRGGRFALAARDVVRSEQRYAGETNVAVTELRCRGGVLRLTDFMPVVSGGESGATLEPEHELVRIAECVEGEVALEADYSPRPDFARRVPRLERRGKLGWWCARGAQAFYLHSDLPFEPAGEGRLAASARLRAGERREAVFSACDSDLAVINPLGESVRRRLAQTDRWWRGWCAKCAYGGAHRDAVLRSLLTLKLLTYCLSGAVVAAATTSLPEGPTGSRNWDYRYCWLRDSSFVLQAFVDLGYDEEAKSFLSWLLHSTRLTQPRLQVVYDLFGETRLDEKALASLSGYRGIGPVRVGNGAHTQFQLDLYGELLLTVFDYVDRGGELGTYERRLVAGFGSAVRELWRKPDKGIWEIRLPARQNTFSKIMCWTGLDRLLRLHERIGLPLDAEAYRVERERIREDVERHGFDRGLNAYVGYYGGRAPDASLLLAARAGYVAADDPRMRGTCDYIVRELSHDGLLYRYPPGGAYDGVEGGENLFGVCSFWLVDYLARAGEVDRAAELLERLVAAASPVGLYAEELDPLTKAPRGNFPQAYTHVGLIGAALALEQAKRGQRGKEIAA